MELGGSAQIISSICVLSLFILGEKPIDAQIPINHIRLYLTAQH